MIPYSNQYLLQYMATLNTTNYTQGLKGMQNQTQGATNKIDSAFGKMTKSINAATIAKGAMAAAAIYVANKLRVTTKEVMAYQKQLGMVNTLLKVSRDELNKYGDEFERLSLKTGASKIEIADAAYQALSSGVGKRDLITFLETASKTAIAGQATVEQSVGTITSIINAYKMEMSEAGKVADWLLTIQNEGVTTVRELGDQLGDVTSISAALGVSLNDVGGAIAQMTVNGNNTAKTITMLKSMLSELSKEGQMAADNFEKLSGQSFTEFIANGGTLQEAMIKMEEYAKKSNKSVVDLFSSVEAGSAALNLTGINAENFANKLDKVASSSGELETAYRTATDNIQSEWEKLIIAMDNKWSKFVKSVVENESLLNFVKNIRRAIDGEDNSLEIQLDREKELPDLKKKLEEITKELEEVRKKREELLKTNPNKSMTLIPTENKLNDKKNQLTWKIQNIEREIKTREEAAKKVEETNQKIVNSESQKNTKLQDLRSQEEERVKLNKENLLKNEFKYLTEKRNYILEQKQLLQEGVIDRDTYNKNIIIKENELYVQQQKSNLKSLMELQNYFKQIDDKIGENEIKRKVIQLEIEIQEKQISGSNYTLDYNEENFLAKQQDEMERYKQSIAASQMESLFNLEKLFGDEENLREERENKALEAQLKELEFEKQLLEERLDFYDRDVMYAQQAADTKLKIKENELKQQQIMKSLEEKNESEKLKIIRWSANTILNTYDLLAQGRIQSLEDFKKFAALELAELLASYGHKHAQIAISEGGLAVVDFAKAATAAASLNGAQAAAFTASAKTHLGAAAENAALAAAFGGAAAAINTNFSSDSGSSSGDEEESSTQYDENIDNVVESSKEESEGTVYINVENSNLMKLFIKEIEKELNDGYNVELIRKKKR